ncbi:MAG: murein tripeptide amidase MpaA [Ilumatobacter sp.]|jgi:murein tripeptide amidase MpaA
MCGIYRNERAARDLAEGVGRINRPDDLHLTIVSAVNPDGWHGGTRHNRRDVDLNRNFP